MRMQLFFDTFAETLDALERCKREYPWLIWYVAHAPGERWRLDGDHFG